MLKVGIIGYGYSARTFHIPLINASSHFQLSAIASSRVDSVKQSHPQLAVYATPKALIESGTIDVVVITAPNSVHFEIAKMCLNNDLHVIVEKPMVTTTKEAYTLRDLANTKERLLSVFHNRRWDGDFLTLEKLIQQKTLGDIRFFESRFDRFRPNVRKRWKEDPGPGAGIWYDLGSHLIDQALCLFGLPESLTARCLALRENGLTSDYFHVQLHYSGLEVVLHSSSFSAGPNQRYRLEGNKGSYIKLGLDPQEQQLQSGISPNDDGYGCEPAEQNGTLHTENNSTSISTERGRYQDYYARFASAIDTPNVNPVSADSAIAIMQIIELAEESSRLGKKLAL